MNPHKQFSTHMTLIMLASQNDKTLSGEILHTCSMLFLLDMTTNDIGFCDKVRKVHQDQWLCMLIAKYSAQCITDTNIFSIQYTSNPTECSARVHRVLSTECVYRGLAECLLSAHWLNHLGYTLKYLYLRRQEFIIPTNFIINQNHMWWHFINQLFWRWLLI